MVLPSTHKWWYNTCQTPPKPFSYAYRWQLPMESQGGNQIITLHAPTANLHVTTKNCKKYHMHWCLPWRCYYHPKHYTTVASCLLQCMKEDLCVLCGPRRRRYIWNNNQPEEGTSWYDVIHLYIVKVRRLMTSFTNCSKHNKWRRKRLPMLYTATNWVWSKGIRYILKVGGERKEVGYASSHL